MTVRANLRHFCFFSPWIAPCSAGDQTQGLHMLGSPLVLGYLHRAPFFNGILQQSSKFHAGKQQGLANLKTCDSKLERTPAVTYWPRVMFRHICTKIINTPHTSPAEKLWLHDFRYNWFVQPSSPQSILEYAITPKRNLTSPRLTTSMPSPSPHGLQQPLSCALFLLGSMWAGLFWTLGIIRIFHLA